MTVKGFFVITDAETVAGDRLDGVVVRMIFVVVNKCDELFLTEDFERHAMRARSPLVKWDVLDADFADEQPAEGLRLHVPRVHSEAVEFSVVWVWQRQSTEHVH